METCSFCGATVDPSLSYRHRKCGHVSHAVCMNAPGVTRDLMNCARVACGGTVIQTDLPGATRALFGAPTAEEPRPADRCDWVLSPGPNQPNRGSTIKSIASALRLVSAVPIEASIDPYVLLAHRVPVRTMITRNKIGLQHCCKEGVTLSDFLRSGYKLSDLMEFRDISGQEGKERALQALALGLRASANHFRDYPNAFPLEGVRKLTAMDNDAMCSYFGLSFPGPQEALQCDGDAQWSASDVLKLGLNIDNLADFGLQTTAQYAELVKGLSEASLAETERRLGVGQRHRLAWAKADALIAEQFVVVATTAAEPIFEEEEEIAAPVYRAIPSSRPVAAAVPHPIINHMPPRAPPTVAAVRSVTTTPALLTYEERAQQRAKMHGFLG